MFDLNGSRAQLLDERAAAGSLGPLFNAALAAHHEDIRFLFARSRFNVSDEKQAIIFCVPLKELQKFYPNDQKR